MDVPRPLADLPPLDAARVARAWLLALLAGAPLSAARELASERFVAEAPAVVEVVAGALGGRAALDALTASPPPLLGALRTGPSAAVLALEALRGAVGEELAPRVPAGERAALHDRLAHVCAALAAAALGTAEPARAAITVSDHRAASHVATPDRGSDDARPVRVDRAGLSAAAAALVGPYCVLALEIEDAGALPPGLLGAGEGALRAGLPAAARFTPDGPGSLLVLLPGGDGRDLARSLVGAVAAVGEHHGAPLRMAAGVAEHPRDGASLDALLAHADGQLFAARAEGLPLV